MAAKKHESKYKEEDNWGELTNCEESPYEGGKASSRPAVFCDTVTALSKTTLNETEIVPPAITVAGQTYVPTVIRVPVLAADGLSVVSYNLITVLAASATG